jgi:hypothetical protein
MPKKRTSNKLRGANGENPASSSVNSREGIQCSLSDLLRNVNHKSGSDLEPTEDHYKKAIKWVTSRLDSDRRQDWRQCESHAKDSYAAALRAAFRLLNQLYPGNTLDFGELYDNVKSGIVEGETKFAAMHGEAEAMFTRFRETILPMLICNVVSQKKPGSIHKGDVCAKQMRTNAKSIKQALIISVQTCFNEMQVKSLLMLVIFIKLESADPTVDCVFWPAFNY